MAINKEMESLQNNQTQDLVELLEGRLVVGCKWIFKKKFGSTSDEVIKYKARLVAKAYSQKEGEGYNEIFSLVVWHTSISVLLAFIATLDMELEQLDVKTIFLHGRLEEDILMQQLEGFKVEGKENVVYRLKKSRQGLKQSLKQQYKRFDEFIISQGYN